jgi:hypothetical protein
LVLNHVFFFSPSGGAFTEAAALTIEQMKPELQEVFFFFSFSFESFAWLTL